MAQFVLTCHISKTNLCLADISITGQQRSFRKCLASHPWGGGGGKTQKKFKPGRTPPGGGGGGNTQKSFKREGSAPRSNPLTLYIILGRKGTHFVYLPLTNGTPFTYLLTAINALS